MAGPTDPFDPTRPQQPDDAGELTATLRAIKEVLVDLRDRVVVLEEASAANLGDETGTIKVFGGNSSTAPQGYVFCEGQALSRETYAELFAVIGTTWGAGDGSTTFNAPDLRGRVVRGLDTTNERDHQVDRIVGSVQEDTLQNFEGTFDVARVGDRTITSPTGIVSVGNGGNRRAIAIASPTSATDRVIISPSNNDSARTSDETVMKNVAARYIIKT